MKHGIEGTSGRLRLSADGRYILIEQGLDTEPVRHRICMASSGARPCSFIVLCGRSIAGEAAASHRRFGLLCTSCTPTSPPFTACAKSAVDLSDWVIGLASLLCAWELGGSAACAGFTGTHAEEEKNKTAQRQLLWQAARLRISELSPLVGVCEAVRLVHSSLERQRHQRGVEFDFYIRC